MPRHMLSEAENFTTKQFLISFQYVLPKVVKIAEVCYSLTKLAQFWGDSAQKLLK